MICLTTRDAAKHSHFNGRAISNVSTIQGYLFQRECRQPRSQVRDYKCLIRNSTLALKTPSLPALTFGLLCWRTNALGKDPLIRRDRLTRSPRTEKPCAQPSQYVRSYPGANAPPPRILSVAACASAGNIISISQLLMRSGAFEALLYF